MFKYILKRIVAMFITLFVIATTTFFMMHSIPGGPFSSERQLPPAVEKAIMAKYNLDAPVHVQYVDYLKDLAKFDLGPSFQKKGLTVNKIIKETFPASLKIGAVASIMVILVGVPLGVLGALKKDTFIDHLVTVVSTIGITIPSFVIGAFMMYVFGERLGWIPAGGISGPRSYIGPVVAIAGLSLAYVARLTRSSMLEVLGQDYIRTAKASGIPNRKVIFKYSLKNALIPVVTYLGPTIASIITGSFVVEKIFNIPGMGSSFVESIGNRDYTMIMGVTIFYAAIYIFMVFLVDIAYALIDPRIKYD